MSPSAAYRIAPLVLLSLALACGDEPPAAVPDASAFDASLIDAGIPSSDADAGAVADAGLHADAGLLDGGEAADAGTDPTGCVGPGGFPSPGPNDPYSAIENLRDEALVEALYERVRDHDWLTYNDARRAMLDTTSGIDVHDGEVECVYTGRTVAAEGATSNGINVEHTWPQNEGAELEPARSDLHHLFPSDSEANLRRGSLPFAFTDCDEAGDCLWTEGGSEIGPIAGGEERVFEVRPERRGDVARAHFYFSVRYRLPIGPTEEAALRCWNWSDPPDDLERARNSLIEAIQHNRNPFVDRPDFVQSVADF